MSTMHPTIKDTLHVARPYIQGCLLGVPIGDAMGMPWETMRSHEILERTKNAGVTTFVESQQTRIKEMIGMPAGSTTDDWQLTQVVAESIIATNGHFDIEDCAKRHLAALAETTFGWGGTTTEALVAIREGHRAINPGFAYQASPSLKNTGCGNGIIMKIAPIAIIHALRSITIQGKPDDEQLNDFTLWANCRDLGMMTHPDMRASITAYAIAFAMSELIRFKIPEGDVRASNNFLRRIGDVVYILEKNARYQPYVPDDMSAGDLFFGCIADYTLTGDWDKPVKVAEGKACFSAMDTMRVCLSIFCRYPYDFHGGVLAAVNAGGDTDTNASIVGALIGAHLGIYAIPQEWLAFNPNFAKAITLADQLFDVVAHAELVSEASGDE